MPIQMPFTENGISVHFPDNNTFRLGDCPAYISLKSNGVKEMDIGWFDLGQNTVWLVGLKAFDNPASPKYQPKDLSSVDVVEDIRRELFTKSIHAICMVNTDRNGTQSCVLPNRIEQNTTINLVHLLKTMPNQEFQLGFLQTKLQTELRALTAIFKINAVVIIGYDNAVKQNLLPWIV